MKRPLNGWLLNWMRQGTCRYREDHYDDCRNVKGNKSAFFEPIIYLIIALGVVIPISLLMGYSRYGLDFTDESFSLVWMSNPFIYKVSVSQFGFIYYPLDTLLHGNIQALRKSNIIISYGLAWLLSDLLLKPVFRNESRKWCRLIVSAGIATVILSFLVPYGHWKLTPNYNSLALQALLIAAVGFLFVDAKSRDGYRYSGWILIGVAGWLAFMAKPTTAFGLGCCVVFYALNTKKLNFGSFLLAAGVAIMLLIVSAIFLDGSVTAFIERLTMSLADEHLFNSGHSISEVFIKLFVFPSGMRSKFLFIVVITFVFVAYFTRSFRLILALSTVAIVAVLILASVVITNDGIGRSDYRAIVVMMLMGLLPFIVTLFIVFNRFNALNKMHHEHIPLALSFIFFPHIYAFGTNNDYLLQASAVGFFWILAALVFLIPIIIERNIIKMIFPFTVATQLVAIGCVLIGFQSPYRQLLPLNQNNYLVVVGKSGSNVVLSERDGRCIEEAKQSAFQANFIMGTPVIDLTGCSPGVLYSLGAKNIGSAWLSGGYPGSNQAAVASLKRVSCNELATAWLLVEHGQPRSLSTAVLACFGANFDQHYKVVASWVAPSRGGINHPVRYQQLLMPTRSLSTAVAACQAERGVLK